MKSNSHSLRVGLAQIRPVWLNREATTARIVDWIAQAAAESCQLVAFGETLLPGYPFWIERTGGAKFECALQQRWHALYLREAVCIEAGHLQPIQAAAAEHEIAVYLGCLERPSQRGGHSVYASLVFIDAAGSIQSVHRKLQPTHEERLSWAAGDGHGLQTHSVGDFTVGGLNCWENWMPLARTSLYAQGENVHVAVWPGNERNTREITRFMALEGRSFVLSVAGLMVRADVPDDVPAAEEFKAACSSWLANGGSCIAGPEGDWIVEPVTGKEALLTAELELERIYAARHSFDPVGHYSRADVLGLRLDRQRQGVME